MELRTVKLLGTTSLMLGNRPCSPLQLVGQNNLFVTGLQEGGWREVQESLPSPLGRSISIAEPCVSVNGMWMDHKATPAFHWNRQAKPQSATLPSQKQNSSSTLPQDGSEKLACESHGFVAKGRGGKKETHCIHSPKLIRRTVSKLKLDLGIEREVDGCLPRSRDRRGQLLRPGESTKSASQESVLRSRSSEEEDFTLHTHRRPLWKPPSS